MTFPYDPTEGLIIVQAETEGSKGNAILHLALDTGATYTVINTSLLIAVGYVPAASSDMMELTTGSGIEHAPRISLARITALGLTRMDFPILAHTTPPSAEVDGVLGLNFLQEQILTIDFQRAQIRLA